jgi:hypothetical protein
MQLSERSLHFLEAPQVLLAALMAGMLCGAASAQTTAQGTINATWST